MQNQTVLIKICICVLILLPTFANSQIDYPYEITLRVETVDIRDIKIVQLEIIPDPVKKGQAVTFQATIHNQTQRLARAHIQIKQKD